MEESKYLAPIQVARSDGMLCITYDQVHVDLPLDGPLPEEAPLLARKIFEAYRSDLQVFPCAE